MSLTFTQSDDKLLFQKRERSEFCMKGGVYTKEKCPVCGGKFIKKENDFLCEIHQTRPRRVYIQLYSKELHRYINIFTDRLGFPFSSYEQAHRILTKIRTEIDEATFDPTRYVAEKLKPLRFDNWSASWLQKKEIEVEKGLRAPAYLKALRVYVSKYEDFFKDSDIREIGTKKSAGVFSIA